LGRRDLDKNSFESKDEISALISKYRDLDTLIIFGFIIILSDICMSSTEGQKEKEKVYACLHR